MLKYILQPPGFTYGGTGLFASSVKITLQKKYYLNFFLKSSVFFT